MNKVILLGHIGRIEPKENLTRVSLATNEKWKDKQGNKQEHTEWHNLVMFGHKKTFADKYLNKGDRVLIEGSIETRKVESEEGDTPKYFTSIITKNIQMINSKQAQDNNLDESRDARDFDKMKQEIVVTDKSYTQEDIPF